MFRFFKRFRRYETREAVWILSRYSVPFVISAGERQERKPRKTETRKSKPVVTRASISASG
jgi:hypothetical protein